MNKMTNEEFKIFTEETIPQQLFHVDKDDIDDRTGGKLDDVILLEIIYQNLGCLKHKPLAWFINTYL